jgi:Ubiquitin-activating enzyme E1 FCCH domain
MVNGTAMIVTSTVTTGAMAWSLLSSNGITPYITQQGLEYVPLTGLPSGATNTNLTITGISKAANASITATHAFTASDVGVTTVTFHNVVGMTQINTLTGVIQSVTSTTSFTVNINTTNFTTYSSGGIANVITGVPALTTTGFQTYNTPLYNVGFAGLTLGTSVMVTAADVWLYEAVLDTPITSA